MKHLLAIFLALSVQSFAIGEVLRFFVLPEEATSPDVRSSLRAFQALTPKLGASVLEVDSLAGVDSISTRSVSIMHDASGKVTDESARDVPSVRIILPAGFQEKFGKITEENIGHRVMIVLGDRILMVPFVHQRIDTPSFLISLGRNATPEETAQIIEALRAMVKKPEANQALQRNDPSCHESCLRTPRASRDRG